MRFFKLSITLFLVSIFISTCNEEDVLPKHYLIATIDPGSFGREDDFVMLKEQIYKDLHQTFTSDSYTLLQNLPSMAVKANPAIQEQVQIDTYQWSPNDLIFKQVWEDFFGALSNINRTIYELDNFYRGDEAAKAFLKEARFIRALYIFEIVVMFGDIPVPISPITNTNDFSNIETVSGEVMWNFLKDELGLALLLSKTTLNRNAVNYWAAKALLGKIQLFKSAKGLSDEWEAAFRNFSDILNSGRFILEKQYNTLFESSFETDIEPVFYTRNLELQPQTKLGAESKDDLLPTDTFIASFENTDNRPLSIFGLENSGDIYFKKYNEAYFNGGVPPFYIFRLADIWLLHSELINIILPGDRTRLTGLNLVKQRSNAQVIENTISDNDFIKSVRLEREKELILEAKSLFDYRRWGLSYIQSIHPQLTIENKHMLFPIPATILQDPLLKIYEQNAGY